MNLKLQQLKTQSLYAKKKNTPVYVDPPIETSVVTMDWNIIIVLSMLFVGIIGATLGWKYIVKPKSGR